MKPCLFYARLNWEGKNELIYMYNFTIALLSLRMGVVAEIGVSGRYRQHSWTCFLPEGIWGKKRVRTETLRGFNVLFCWGPMCHYIPEFRSLFFHPILTLIYYPKTILISRKQHI